MIISSWGVGGDRWWIDQSNLGTLSHYDGAGYIIKPRQYQLLVRLANQHEQMIGSRLQVVREFSVCLLGRLKDPGVIQGIVLSVKR